MNTKVEAKPEAKVEAETKIDADAIMESIEKDSDMKYTLSRKIKIADKEYSEVTLDFDKLTGADMESIASLPGCNSGDYAMSEFSKTYLMHVVALATGITINELRIFPMADCTAMTMRAQVFLMKAASAAKAT